MPQPVHIINSFHSAVGGSEWHALSLFEILAEYTDVQLWTEYKPDPALIGKYPIHGIEPHQGRFPKKGNFIFIGAYFGIGPWLRAASPNRVVVFFNTPDIDRLKHVVEGIQSTGAPKVEVVYQAEEHRAVFPQYPGPVHSSPIDLSQFQPNRVEHNGFTVGRYSRDHDDKHHADNPELYRRLADAGCKVRIMGGMVQRELMADDRIEIIEAGSVPPQEFLSTLDCFLYRIRADWFEAFGRVVAESLACGVPVVAENRGGFTHLIENGRNGFLFDNNDEAFEQVMQIKSDADLQRSMSANARQMILDYYSPEAMAKMAEFYYQ